jgi:hypothetical protein
VATAACQRSIFEPSTVAPSTLRDVPALRLNFRYEADVPAPSEQTAPQTEEKNAAVQADFDANRPQEILVKTIPSPNKQRFLTVYQRLGDPDASFRLDMYAADGKFMRRVSPETMTVDFPDIIVWSPDSGTVAFVAIAREGGLNSLTPPPIANANANANSNAVPSAPNATNANTNSNADANANTDANTNAPAAAAAPLGEAAPNVITFRTEQIYICNSEGLDLKPVTQNEGLIYYYFVWSPDNSALAALAATYQEWRVMQDRAERSGEVFVPLGRPRIVEKNGRERRLDDNLTAARPVWSPDSAKVAVGYNSNDSKPTQIRIYDAIGDQPTQAAIPIRNQLLISSQAYDQKVNSEQDPAQAAPDGNANANTNANPAQPPSMTLPDERTLVSFQPIVALEWSADNLLYFQTGFVKQYKTGDGARSSLRWHRLVLSPQAAAIK